MPEFPGGNDALRKFIKNNTRKDLTLQTGKNSVYVQFTVNHDGSLTDIETKGNDVLAKEAVRIVTAMLNGCRECSMEKHAGTYLSEN